MAHATVRVTCQTPGSGSAARAGAPLDSRGLPKALPGPACGGGCRSPNLSHLRASVFRGQVPQPQRENRGLLGGFSAGDAGPATC